MGDQLKIVRRLLTCFIAMAALAMPLTAMVATAPPAAAHDMGTFGFWGQPPNIFFDGNSYDNLTDAAYFWQDLGFPGYGQLGLNVGGSYCGNPYYEGWIGICTVPRSIVYNYCPGCDGFTQTVWYSGSQRIYGAYTLIADDLSPYRRQQVWRHEVGHAIGLAHTAYTSCVMVANANVPLGSYCSHDYWEVKYYKYPNGFPGLPT